MRNILIILMITVLSCTRKEIVIKPDHKYIKYMGRIDSTDNSNYKLFWSGTSAKVKFKGTTIKTLIWDEKGKNYYNVIVDDSLYILYLDDYKRWYTLASNLKDTIHTVELFKRTEFKSGTTNFYGFRLSDGGKILPLIKNCKNRMIEFYGNSITSGYGVEDYSGSDSPDSIYTNNYYSYSAITARNFNADYSCIAESGIGIMISWFPEVIDDIWDKLDPLDENSKWDFSLIQPNIVVVNLFQNDSWLVNKPYHKEFKKKFDTSPPDEKYIVSSYMKFISKIRAVYPNTNIICVLGNMDATRIDSPWPGYVEQAVKKMKKKIQQYTQSFSLIKIHLVILE